MKKRVVWVLALILLFTALPWPCVNAAETVDSGTCGDHLAWALDDSGTLTFSGSGDIPSYNVTYTADNTPWAVYKDRITRIVIEDGITKIGIGAFENCTALVAVTIPDSVTVIGERAFKNCTALVDLDLGNGLHTLEKEAFSLCRSLLEVTLPESLTTMEELAFSYCDKLVHITIPDGVTLFGRRMFYSCTALMYISMPDTVGGIDGETFAWCESLWHVLYRGRKTYVETPHGAAVPNRNFRDSTKHYQCSGEEITAIRIEATCNTIGMLTVSCALCQESRSVALLQGDHTWKEATCTDPKTCLVCNATSGNPLGSDHIWDEGTVIQEPADDAEGIVHYTCTICSETKMDFLESPQETPAEPQPMSGTTIFIIIIVSLVVVIIGAALLVFLRRQKA